MTTCITCDVMVFVLCSSDVTVGVAATFALVLRVCSSSWHNSFVVRRTCDQKGVFQSVAGTRRQAVRDFHPPVASDT